MVRKRRTTEEFLNPWAGEVGWKTDPRQFSVISGTQQAQQPKKVSQPRSFKKRTPPKKSLIPFNWLQLITLLLGVVAVALVLSLVNIVTAV